MGDNRESGVLGWKLSAAWFEWRTQNMNPFVGRLMQNSGWRGRLRLWASCRRCIGGMWSCWVGTSWNIRFSFAHVVSRSFVWMGSFSTHNRGLVMDYCGGSEGQQFRGTGRWFWGERRLTFLLSTKLCARLQFYRVEGHFCEANFGGVDDIFGGRSIVCQGTIQFQVVV